MVYDWNEYSVTDVKVRKKEFLSQDTFISDPTDELVIRKNARIYCAGVPRLEAHGRSKVLGRNAIGIGRDKHNAVIIADSQVSKFHAIMSFKKSTAYIRDTGSTNGTYVNDTRIQPNREVALADRDILVLGTTKITIHYREPATRR